MSIKEILLDIVILMNVVSGITVIFYILRVERYKMKHLILVLIVPQSLILLLFAFGIVKFIDLFFKAKENSVFKNFLFWLNKDIKSNFLDKHIYERNKNYYE